jgi:protein-L-isoaspartate(D-aspartate) O-methyltransferase
MRAPGRMLLLLVLLAAISCAAPQAAAPSTAGPSSPAPPTGEAGFTQQRLEMVQTTIADRGVSDPDVLRAMRTVPRHRFVLPEYLDMAYADCPLPIGYGQTISQPYMVAWMTELLELKPGEKVLEIGTGSGYQAAVLAELGYVDVYSVEIIPELAEQARERLQELGYSQVHLQQADGYYGWAEHAPYDAIVVTAAPDHLPAPLVAQLKEGGRLVIPIGPPGSIQTLWRFQRTADSVTAYNLGGVSFVPFTGAGAAHPEPTP